METNTELKQIQIDECIREQAEQSLLFEDTDEKRIKVTSAEIIATGTKGLRQDKPYYEIKYKEVGKNEYNIGFGSYKLPYVLHWLDTCFEIVEQ